MDTAGHPNCDCDTACHPVSEISGSAPFRPLSPVSDHFDFDNAAAASVLSLAHKSAADTTGISVSSDTDRHGCDLLFHMENLKCLLHFFGNTNDPLIKVTIF